MQGPQQCLHLAPVSLFVSQEGQVEQAAHHERLSHRGQPSLGAEGHKQPGSECEGNPSPLSPLLPPAPQIYKCLPLSHPGAVGEQQGGDGETALGDKAGMGRSDKGDGKEASPTSSPIGTPPRGAPAFCCVHRKALRWWRSGWEGSKGSTVSGQDASRLGRGPFSWLLVPSHAAHRGPAGAGLWARRQREPRCSLTQRPAHAAPLPALREAATGVKDES